MAATIHLEDVNALVALASTIPRRQNPTLSRHDPEVHENRLNIILNAIASICVSQAKGEVYSTAMELMPGPGPAGEVRLFIAGNVDVSEDVGKHIQELWMILKNIARDCLGARKPQNPKDPCLQWGYQEVSLPRNDILATEDLKRLRNEFIHKIYNHSFPKFVARVQKRWDQYLEFWGIMRKEIILGENIPSEILPLFFLRKMGDLMWGTEQRKPQLAISDPRVYERLCLKVAEYEGPNLPLTRYLDKIVSLHVSADVLDTYQLPGSSGWRVSRKLFLIPATKLVQ
ncbi:hypothetical protein BGX38DRAFT_1334344 [Terfezia claveryi]|nr:hypothetical protein BGX38DRAFT_1334344 [Terfezia claveryi]